MPKVWKGPDQEEEHNFLKKMKDKGMEGVPLKRRGL
jgi:hypothetical protein